MYKLNSVIKIAIIVLVFAIVLTHTLSTETKREPILTADGSIGSHGGYRWGLDAIKAPDAWKVTRGSPSVVVAVIDGGIDFDVPALSEHRWKNPAEVPDNGDNDGNGYVDDLHGWDFRNDRPVSNHQADRYYHGTFIAGLIASTHEPESGTGGVAPEIKLMDLRVLNSRGRAFPSDWPKFASAIRYATDNGAEIINLSLSASREPPEVVRKAIRHADNNGVLVVTSAGNGGEKVQALAQLEDVIAVGAVDKNGSRASFSPSGPEVDLMAPGDRVLSFKKGKPVVGSGTSFASAHLSGAAALLLSERPEAEKDIIEESLLKSTENLSPSRADPKTESGFLNVDRALTELTSLLS